MQFHHYCNSNSMLSFTSLVPSCNLYEFTHVSCPKGKGSGFSKMESPSLHNDMVLLVQGKAGLKAA